MKGAQKLPKSGQFSHSARSVTAAPAHAAQEGGVLPGLASISVPSLPVCHYVTISTSWDIVSCQHILELHRHRYYQLYNAIYFNNFNHPPTSFINCRILIKIEKRSRTTSILIVVSLHILTFEIPIQNQNLSWTLDLDWTWSLKFISF